MELADLSVAEIHDRMPAILAPRDCIRWLGDEGYRVETLTGQSPHPIGFRMAKPIDLPFGEV